MLRVQEQHVVVHQSRVCYSMKPDGRSSNVRRRLVKTSSMSLRTTLIAESKE